MRKKFRFSKNSITWKIVMLLILFIAPFNLAALYTAQHFHRKCLPADRDDDGKSGAAHGPAAGEPHRGG